jgi:hypothetical protein
MRFGRSFLIIIAGCGPPAGRSSFGVAKAVHALVNLQRRMWMLGLSPAPHQHPIGSNPPWRTIFSYVRLSPPYVADLADPLALWRLPL